MGQSRRWVVAILALGPGCFWWGGDEPPPPDAAPPVPIGCISWEDREKTRVTVSGMVVDFVTGAPVAGAVVEVTTGWDVEGFFPRPECPTIIAFDTDAQGRFGPKQIIAGSPTEPNPILVFLVRGGDRGVMASDARAAACGDGICDALDHTIPVPSVALEASWRTELANGGMAEAATRALVAFKFKNTDQTGAAGVVPFEGSAVTRNLIPNSEVRFVTADQTGLAPTTQTTTTASGFVLVGPSSTIGRVDIGGRRGAESWPGLSCLVSNGYTFFEDKTVSPSL